MPIVLRSPAEPEVDRVLLVGEINPYGSDPRFALYPSPVGSAGHRLAAILGMEAREYLRAFARVNLLTTATRWSTPAGRAAARALTHSRRILLGAKVCAAHGVPFVPFTFVDEHSTTDYGTWRGLILPHPSGINRAWNLASNKALARDLVRDFLVAA